MPDGLQSGGLQTGGLTTGTVVGGSDAAVLQAAADKDRQARAKEGREAKIEKRDEEKKFGKPLVRVSINKPHTAKVHGNQIALNISTGNDPSGSVSGTDLPGNPVSDGDYVPVLNMASGVATLSWELVTAC